jgi:hypothetical protein
MFPFGNTLDNRSSLTDSLSTRALCITDHRTQTRLLVQGVAAPYDRPWHTTGCDVSGTARRIAEATAGGMMTDLLVPGVFVRLPTQPDWGIGQVQSVIGQRITVNFEHAGKRLINGAVVTLEVVGDSDR